MGRATQGVKIIRLRDDDSIASVAKVSKWEEEELIDEEGNETEDLANDGNTNEDETKTNEKNIENED